MGRQYWWQLDEEKGNCTGLLERKGKFNESLVHEGTNIIKGYNNQCVITTWDHNVETMGINKTESSPVGTHLWRDTYRQKNKLEPTENTK